MGHYKWCTDTSDPRHFGPKTVRHQCRSIRWTLRPLHKMLKTVRHQCHNTDKILISSQPNQFNTSHEIPSFPFPSLPVPSHVLYRPSHYFYPLSRLSSKNSKQSAMNQLKIKKHKFLPRDAMLSSVISVCLHSYFQMIVGLQPDLGLVGFAEYKQAKQCIT